MPQLQQSDLPGHFFRCWYPVGSPEYFESKERNAAKAMASAAPTEVAVSIGEAR